VSSREYRSKETKTRQVTRNVEDPAGPTGSPCCKQRGPYRGREVSPRWGERQKSTQKTKPSPGLKESFSANEKRGNKHPRDRGPRKGGVTGLLKAGIRSRGKKGLRGHSSKEGEGGFKKEIEGNYPRDEPQFACEKQTPVKKKRAPPRKGTSTGAMWGGGTKGAPAPEPAGKRKKKMPEEKILHHGDDDHRCSTDDSGVLT